MTYLYDTRQIARPSSPDWMIDITWNGVNTP
jgi:hypothetical protein